MTNEKKLCKYCKKVAIDKRTKEGKKGFCCESCMKKWNEEHKKDSKKKKGGSINSGCGSSSIMKTTSVPTLYGG